VNKDSLCRPCRSLKQVDERRFAAAANALHSKGIARKKEAEEKLADVEQAFVGLSSHSEQMLR